MKRAAATLALAVATLAPAAAAAFSQTMTCDESGMYACRSGEVAKVVRWPDRCVTYYINEDLTADIADDSRTMAAVQRSFTTWGEVTGAEFLMQYGGLTNEDRAEHDNSRGAVGNANIVVWRDGKWPYASARGAFAITSVTFDPVTGLIADADIELNSEWHQFTAGDSRVVVDVSNTLTHEVGHFLGLDHTPDTEATMYGTAPEGETQKRTLEPDDIAGMMATYPPVGIIPQCQSAPDYFEKPENQSDDGCCATASTPPAPTGRFALLFLAVLLLRRRRDPDKLIEA